MTSCWQKKLLDGLNVCPMSLCELARDALKLKYNPKQDLASSEAHKQGFLVSLGPQSRLAITNTAGWAQLMLDLGELGPRKSQT